VRPTAVRRSQLIDINAVTVRASEPPQAASDTALSLLPTLQQPNTRRLAQQVASWTVSVPPINP
jgi:hypothetical protein